MSSKRNTNYNKSWEAELFSISEGGIAQEKILKSSKLHISREKEREGQCIFKKDGDNALSLDCTQITLAKEDLIRKAKIIRALKCVEFNHSYLSTSNDSKIFKEISETGKLLRNANKVRLKRNTPFNMVSIPT